MRFWTTTPRSWLSPTWRPVRDIDRQTRSLWTIKRSCCRTREYLIKRKTCLHQSLLLPANSKTAKSLSLNWILVRSFNTKIVINQAHTPVRDRRQTVITTTRWSIMINAIIKNRLLLQISQLLRFIRNKVKSTRGSNSSSRVTISARTHQIWTFSMPMTPFRRLKGLIIWARRSWTCLNWSLTPLSCNKWQASSKLSKRRWLHQDLHSVIINTLKWDRARVACT